MAGLGGAFAVAILGVHVFELAGLENLAALQALDEFTVLVPSDDLHPLVHTSAVGSLLLMGCAGTGR